MSINPEVTTVEPEKLHPNGVRWHGWDITAAKQPMFNSQELDRLQDATKLEKLPDMIFGHNYIRFHYPATGFEYVCNAIDGVRLISKQPDAGIKVSHSEKWSSGKKLDEYMEKSFNWTFSTAYQGTLLVNDKEPEPGHRVGSIEPTTEQININKLKAQDPILFYEEVILYEDELGDCGASILNARVGDAVFVLCALALLATRRQCGVSKRFSRAILFYRAYDTRLYHEFGKDYILREVQYKESTYDALKKVCYAVEEINPNSACCAPNKRQIGDHEFDMMIRLANILQMFEKDPSALHDPNNVVPVLPVKETFVQKIYFK